MRLTHRAFPFVTLALLLPAGPLAAAGPRPLIVVEATYPGANAEVVADTVAAPIEKEVNGVEKLRHMVSRSSDDGRYTLLLDFEPGTDLTFAQVLVQNRVNIAEVKLPEAVKRIGVTTRKRSAAPLLFVTLYSPNSRHDTLYLGIYASTHLKDELARIAGVGEVVPIGGQGAGLRVWLDPEKLAARGLTASDVTRAIRQHNMPPAAGQVGKPAGDGAFELTIRLGRLSGPEEIGDIVLRSDAGRTVRIKDVARVEMGGEPSPGFASLDGKPAVTLALYAIPQTRPRDLGAAVRTRMERLKKAFPDGLDYSLAFDLTEGSGPKAPGYLLVEPTLPAGASAERTRKVVERCGAILREESRVQHVLALSDNPFARFRDGPCVVAQLAPDTKPADRERLALAIRAQLKEATVRLRDAAEAGGYPIDFAVRGPDPKLVRDLAGTLVERLEATGKLTDVAAGRAAVRQPRVFVDIDRTKTKAIGVPLTDVSDTLNAYFGAADFGELTRAGGGKVRVQFDGRNRVEDLKRLSVRNSDGKMVPLSTVATIREVDGPTAIDRLDLEPMVDVSANPARGLSLAEARWLCEKLAEKELPRVYSLVWLQDVPPAKAIPGGLKAEAPDAPPPEVTVVRPSAREVTDYEEFTGRLQAAASVDLRARVSGYLTKVAFKEGSDVKKGDLLFEIDARPYQADVDRADAALNLAEARKKRTDADFARAKALLERQAVSREEFDKIAAERDEAAAALAAAKADREVVRLRLSFTKVTAPIDGRIGRTLVDPGNLVKADDTSLGTIFSMDPIYAYFDLDERTLLRLTRLAREGKFKGLREGEVPADMGLADENGFPRRGTVNFVDNRVDPDTGTVRARAVFANRDGALVPGLFARVRLAIGNPHKALLVPEEAIRTDQEQKVVYVVNDKDQVVSRHVVVGTAHDGLRVIAEGLKPEDRVITGGGRRVRPGMTVKPVVAEPQRDRGDK
jgi:RND family efflux transporter MFP subunit